MALPSDPTNANSSRYPKDFLDDLEEMLERTKKLIKTIQNDPVVLKDGLRAHTPKIPDRAKVG